jgi:2-C-methyl-D-erythritol 4-phosphate cytidylyltransferase
MLAAIIVAAGSSQRLGFDKIAASIAGKTVLEHSIHAFAISPSVTEIIVVTRADHVEEALRKTENIGKRSVVIAGGAERQDSVRRGIEALSGDVTFVAVHDAARPLVTPDQIDAVYMAAREHGAASLVAPVSDTLKRASPEGFVLESIDRRNVYAMQTPQVFARDVLQESYLRLAELGHAVTDEVSAVELLGRAVFLVPADGPNFKITFKADLDLAETVLRRRLALP